MNGSTRKIIAAGAAMVFGVVVMNSAMAEKAPAAALQAAAPAAVTKHAHVMKHKRAVSAQVKALQEALNKGGAKLAVDGYLGKKTREALKLYQTKHGLKSSGHADRKTLEALGLKS